MGVAARLALYDDPDAGGSDGVLALVAQGGDDVQSLRLRLGHDVLPQAGRRRWESGRLPTTTHSMGALTGTDGDEAPVVGIRSRRDGSWTPWVPVPPLADIPEGEAAGADRVWGTDLMWIGRANGVQIRVEGRRPRDLTLVLLYPQPRSSDDLPPEVSARTARRESEDPRVPRPDLVTREEWGANESLRDGDPTYNHTLKQVHVHHTVNANDYARRDVPALIRGMYAYHTQSLGWSDIGYNFLVDRFGRAFVGRAGGPRKLVRGAHTLGFNAESTGISAIGNYETVQPSDGMLNAIAAIAAWKLDRFDRDPKGTIRVESEGSDKYRTGRVVRLPVIDGHRDTNDTACPGGHLYEALPKVRRCAARLIEAARARPIVVERSAVLSGVTQLGETLTVDTGAYQPDEAQASFSWLRGEDSIPGEVLPSYVLRAEDVGTTVGCVMSLTLDGAEPVVQRLVPAGPVTATPKLQVLTSSRRRVVRVAVTATAPDGVSAIPTGQLRVVVGERAKVIDLADGRAQARFGRRRRLALGTHDVLVDYQGDGSFVAAEWSGSVRIG